MNPALLTLVGGVLTLTSNGHPVSALQWRGTAQATPVASKTLKCSATTCLISGLNQTVIPDGPVATGVASVALPVAVGPDGLAVPIRVLLPPATLTVRPQ